MIRFGMGIIHFQYERCIKSANIMLIYWNMFSNVVKRCSIKGFTYGFLIAPFSGRSGIIDAGHDCLLMIL
ncbi:hypothetical protein CORMATOL_00783 [Corynebacterium matruchotii ATCC 33806]|uniref:Uncharacterized protein n=1 Tax=Corynebacterium matruchotii ATCC 33806 TaxID=566549 RepID=C0E1D2_9CORY|nr:hypothetical protein CORMATOL_00783 [Corynebacterium matruchotii ATCC 33806]